MEFKAKGLELLEGFQLAASVVGPKATREVTRNTKLVAATTERGPEIGVYAVGDETALQYRISPIELRQEGSVVLPSETMVGVLREVRGHEVDLRVEELSCEVTMENSFFKVLGEDPSSFPDEDVFQEEGAITLPADLLASMLSRIIFACSTEDARYAMNGILFNLEDGMLELVSTDGRRLAFVEDKVPEAKKAEGVIVPRTSVLQAQKLLGNLGGDAVRLSLTEHRFSLETDRGVLFSRLIDGKFPPHREVIPKKTTFGVEFSRSALLGAVRQAALLTDPASKSVRFTFSGDQLEISSRTADKGEARIRVDAGYGRDEEFVIHFNPDYIADCLKVLECEQVRFEFTDTAHQAVIKDDAGFLYIIMPVTPSGV